MLKTILRLAALHGGEPPGALDLIRKGKAFPLIIAAKPLYV